MDENCKRQKEVERTYGGLLPAVEGHSLGTRYKVQGTFNEKNGDGPWDCVCAKKKSGGKKGGGGGRRTHWQ